jgi:ribonuclease HI
MNEGDTSEAGRHLIFFDGACGKNGRPGAFAGYGVFFGYEDARNVAQHLDGELQTNQRAELMAFVVALRFIDSCARAIRKNKNQEGGEEKEGEEDKTAATLLLRTQEKKKKKDVSAKEFVIKAGSFDDLEQQVEARTEAEMLRSVNLAGGFATTVISDSVYCVKGYNEWIRGWVRRGWLTSSQKPVKNLDLWQEVWTMKTVVELCPFVDVRIRWVKGHSTCPGNQEADRLAVVGRNMNPLRYE